MRTTSVPPPVPPSAPDPAWHCLSPCTAELLLLLVPSALAMPWLHPELFISNQKHCKLLILVLRCCLAGDVVGKIGSPAAWSPPPPSGRKCYEPWSDRMLPIPKGFPSSQGEQGAPGSSSAVGSAAFSREERGHRASPGHNPIPQDAQGSAGPARLFGLCTAESGSCLINRFQTLPSRGFCSCVCAANTSFLLQLFLDHLDTEQAKSLQEGEPGKSCVLA